MICMFVSFKQGLYHGNSSVEEGRIRGMECDADEKGILKMNLNSCVIFYECSEKPQRALCL